jgi:DNA-directed RNA polymerase subunit RPC12/RpoP
MSVPVEQRPAGWDHWIYKDQAWHWDLPHATIGYAKDGTPHPFPVCDLCGRCCGHVQPMILSCTECRERRELIRETYRELRETHERLRCTSCGKSFQVEHWSQLGISSDTDGVVAECPHCGGEGEVW